jgi:hypothetical protein
VTIVDNFRAGETVTVVTRDAVAAFLHARDAKQCRRQLVYLREAGVLIHGPHRLQQPVRAHDGTRFRAYVFRGLPDEVPKVRRRSTGRKGRARVILA